MAVAFGFYPILDKSHVLSRATREVYTGDGLPLTRMGNYRKQIGGSRSLSMDKNRY